MTDITSWAPLRCIGPRKHDPYNSCGRMVAEVDLVPGSRVRVRCHACGFFTEAIVVQHMGGLGLSYVRPVDSSSAMTIVAVAEILKCSEQQVRQLIASNMLAMVDTPYGSRVTKESVARLDPKVIVQQVIPATVVAVTHVASFATASR